MDLPEQNAKVVIIFPHELEQSASLFHFVLTLYVRLMAESAYCLRIGCLWCVAHVQGHVLCSFGCSFVLAGRRHDLCIGHDGHDVT